MFLNLYNKRIKVFLADVSPDVEDLRQELMIILQRAEIEIVPEIKNADCSVHILGNADIYTENSEYKNSPAGVQYRDAKELCGEKFKMFVWNPAGKITAENAYLNNIRRDIVQNTVYIDKPSPINFVEDIRNIMNIKETAVQESEPSDIFFIYNELDNDTAEGICNMLKDFLQVKKLGIRMSDETDYGSFIKQQLSDSKIGVVYYNFASDWAVPFARQVWKDNGGNSSLTPVFVVGNSEHATQDELKNFNGFMECTVDEQLRIPLDIKVFLDKTIQKL
ncbi:MAG: hypothetical protein II956_07860 [Bacteroidales bacterium]|nr:hypothetical protein [Bacteroidales bacterium]